MLRDSLVKLRVPQALDAFSRYYFQLDIVGKENLSLLRDQQAMLVMNHTAFFALECYLLGSNLLSSYPDLDLRTLVWKGFSEGPARAWFKNIGCETASIQNGHSLLEAGKTVLIMPEGIDATDVRNRMNTFHTGYLRVLQKKRVPIIPIGFHGIDQSIPWLIAHNKTLEKKFMKPVNPNFDFLLLPKVPIFRPTKVVFKIGAPIHLADKDMASEAALNATNERIKTTVSMLVDEAEQYRKERITQSRPNRLFHKLVEGKISHLNKRR
jgi:1-acyl-sn-glycerol-3-phosphate acyltransferase